MKMDGGTHRVELNRMPVAWDLDAGTLHFLERPTAMFWLDPSMRRMLEPLVEELGAPLFRLLVAHASAEGTDQDYRDMVTVLGATFEEGFLAWGRAVAAAGWGSFELPVFDPAERRASVIVNNPWELQMQEDVAARWGCPFLMGKVVGIFSHALGVNCWADEVVVDRGGAERAVELRVFPSRMTIAGELQRLRQAHLEEARRPLERAERLLADKLAVIERQQDAIRALSTPILQVWDGVLALPVVGVVDSVRAADLTERLLDAIVRTQARFAILDLTGVDVIDTSTADHFARILRAVALLGAECVVCGIRPAVAQTMIAIDAGIGRARTYATMQRALQAVLRQAG